MHFLAPSFVALALTSAASATISVLIPAYAYPFLATKSAPATWQPIYDALGNYSSINFFIIVNVNSGPGCNGYAGPGGPSCTHPTDSNFVTAISTLNKYKNAYPLGYISTNYTKRPYQNVTKDIDTYAMWGYYASANVSMAGIFFDEMNNTAKSASYTYYKNASTYAYNQVPSDVTFVVMNPGVPAPSTYFNYADYIVEYEDTYADYKNTTTIKTFTSGYNSQAAVIINETPAAGTTVAALSSLVHPMITNGIGAVYFTTDANYQSFSMLKNLSAAITKG